MEILQLKSDWKDLHKFISHVYSSVIKSKEPPTDVSLEDHLADEELKQRVAR